MTAEQMYQRMLDLAALEDWRASWSAYVCWRCILATKGVA